MRRTSHESAGRAPPSRVHRVRPGWHGLLLFVVGWSGVGLAYLVAERFADRASGGAVLATAAVAAFSLGAIAAGAGNAVTAALSPSRHVFQARPAFLAATMLLPGVVVAVASLIIRAPFAEIAAHGKPLAELITELSCIAASLISLVGSGVAFRGAWTARRDERHWNRSTDT